MIINVSVAVSRIIDECNIQTSLDLQAMRAKGVETANAIYDDWVMTEDDREPIYYALQDICTDMAFSLRTIIKTYSAGRDVISVDLDNTTTEANEGNVLEGLMRQYLKYALLSWWYHYRDAELSARYGEVAAGSLNNIFNNCIAFTGTLVGHHY